MAVPYDAGACHFVARRANTGACHTTTPCGRIPAHAIPPPRAGEYRRINAPFLFAPTDVQPYGRPVRCRRMPFRRPSGEYRRMPYHNPVWANTGECHTTTPCGRIPAHKCAVFIRPYGVQPYGRPVRCRRMPFHPRRANTGAYHFIPVGRIPANEFAVLFAPTVYNMIRAPVRGGRHTQNTMPSNCLAWWKSP